MSISASVPSVCRPRRPRSSPLYRLIEEHFEGFHVHLGPVIHTYTNPYDHSEYTEKVTPYELIARLVTHIPDPREQVTRYFGFYSSRTRGKRRSGHHPRYQTDGEQEERAPRKILAHLKEKGIDTRAGPFEECAA